jgi:hypothetical protein
MIYLQRVYCLAHVLAALAKDLQQLLNFKRNPSRVLY